MHEGPTTEAPAAVSGSTLAPLDAVVVGDPATDRTPDEADHHQGHPPSARPRRRWWRWVVVVVACLVVGATVFGLVRDQVRVTTRADRARATTTRVRHQLHLTTGQLESVRRQLAGGREQLGEATTALASDETQLAGAKSALEHAQQSVTQQGSVLTSLDACLVGVEGALNALSVGDQAKAVAALTAVQPSCEQASDGV